MAPAAGMVRAVQCEKISASALEGIEASVLKDIPRKAELLNGEVRVSVRAASLNFPELLMLQNKYQYKPTLPFTLTTEGSGVVSQVGPGVEGIKQGDEVFFAWMGGCAAEEVVVPSRICVPKPPNLSFAQAASFSMGYTTGYHALVHRGQIKAGEWLLVTGAGGGMGLMAVQLGKALGANVIAAASSDEKLEACKKAGADHVVNYGRQKLKDAVGEITGGAFCDVIYDPVGGDIFDQCVRCVAVKGGARLLVVGFASGTIPKFSINMALIKGFSLVGVRTGHQLAVEKEKNTDSMRELLRLTAEGKLVPPVTAEFPVEQYRDAFHLMESKRVVGKCCITFGGASKL